MASPKVVIEGRIERKEFKEPFRQWSKMLEEIAIPYEINSTATKEPIAFALFFQSYPHEFSRSYLEQRHRINPFAPFFFVLGACCEGMLRTAGPLDSPFYCYAHAWSDKETEQIRLFLTDQPSVFSLPPTTDQDEIAQWENPAVATPPPPNPPPKGKESIKNCLILTHFGPFGNDPEMNRLLADEQKRIGCVPVFSGNTLPDALSGNIIADVDNSPHEKILESIQRLRRQFADNDFTVYVDSPRIDEKNDYLRVGVTRILPKIR